MREPRFFAMQAENAARLPDGNAERFAGYGVLGVPFATGHVLALRRFAASSIGPAYASVWHRNPVGEWTFYQDVEPRQACARYFGRMVSRNIVRPIRCEWTGPFEFQVAVDGRDGLQWRVRLHSTVATRLLNALSTLIPQAWWHRSSLVNAVGRVASLLLRTGRLCLAGKTPNGQTFLANPHRIWLIADSEATVAGQHLGRPAQLPEQVRLGDFWIPQRGLFAIARAYLETLSQSCPLPISRAEATPPG